ncbi:palmitoyltransferase ZDHHC15B-like isoform X3 [Ptychodera flava]|uniref:palmitoyltransferase ZDHHC15B-like isoform X3 n=1 Tax=Ptychodera flava TaxID=63121 RepID=UPI00396A8C53
MAGILRSCARVFQWVPVLFISAIVAWSYYAYIIQLCILTVDNLVEKILYGIFYHIFLFMFAWSYAKSIFTPIGRIPKEFYLSSANLEALENEERGDRQDQILKQIAKNLPVSTRTMAGGIRYCDICKAIKPDRCHHCSVCEACVLKMDHHCPWVNNCVGYSNYKFFILFLMYALAYCLYVAATALQYFIGFWTNTLDNGSGKFHILFLFFAAAMFALSLVSLFGYHCYLVSSNKTTLESFRTPVFRSGPDKDGFSLGTKCDNIREVFGDEPKLWWIPIKTNLGDGVVFAIRAPTDTDYLLANRPRLSDVLSPSFNDEASKGDGRSFPTRTESEDSDHLLAERQRWAEEGMESDTTNNEDNVKIDITHSGLANTSDEESLVPQTDRRA